MTENVESAQSNDVTPVESLEALLGEIELVGVRYLEISGAAYRKDDREDVNKIDVSVAHDLGDGRFEVRIRMAVATKDGDYVVEVGQQYSQQGNLDIPTAILIEFVERVAAMGAFPFLREGLASTAARLELTVPIVGFVRAGQFKITATDSADAEAP